jgi:hypothetical protein
MTSNTSKHLGSQKELRLSRDETAPLIIEQQRGR